MNLHRYCQADLTLERQVGLQEADVTPEME